MKRYILGIDMGTQGTKTVLYDFWGNAVSSSFEPSNLISPMPGVVEQDPEEIYNSVINTIREVLVKVGNENYSIEAIGIDSQMSGIMAVDNDWNAVTPYDSWLDTRCEKYIKDMKKSAEDEIIKITGCPPTYHHGPKILWWKNERVEVYKKIAKFIIPSVYVSGRLAGLTGENAYIDYTNIHFSGFAETDNMKWSDKLLDLFGVDKEKMPRITHPWEIIGHLTKAEAQKTGLKSGIPIVAGCGDQAATSLGAGVVKKGIAFDVAGTASVFSCCVDSFNPDIKNKTLIFARSCIEGLWIPLSYINGGGLCLKWFRDNLTGKEKSMEYFQLDEEAMLIEAGSNGLFFNPHFGGRVCPNSPGVRGSWIGLNWGHTRAHMYRSVMESIAYEYDLYLGIVKELFSDLEFKRVISIGGGAKSQIFSSIKSDVLNIPYALLKNSDTATLGSALVAGYGVGIFEDLVSAAEKISTIEKTVEVGVENNKKYKKTSLAYRKILATIDTLYSEIEKLER